MIEKLKYLPKAVKTFIGIFLSPLIKKNYGYWGKNVELQLPLIVTNSKNVFLYDNVNILGFSSLIIGKEGKFIIKKNSGCAQGLTVVNTNHTTHPTIGKWFKEVISDSTTDSPKDIIIEEDVWVGANVTLLPGVTIGRGSIIGAGSVCRSSIPPYSLVMGNPAKIIGFKYTPEEIIEHEKKLYPIEERYTKEYLEKNYKRYYLDRIIEISKFLKK